MWVCLSHPLEGQASQKPQVSPGLGPASSLLMPLSRFRESEAWMVPMVPKGAW